MAAAAPVDSLLEVIKNKGFGVVDPGTCLFALPPASSIPSAVFASDVLGPRSQFSVLIECDGYRELYRHDDCRSDEEDQNVKITFAEVIPFFTQNLSRALDRIIFHMAVEKGLGQDSGNLLQSSGTLINHDNNFSFEGRIDSKHFGLAGSLGSYVLEPGSATYTATFNKDHKRWELVVLKADGNLGRWIREGKISELDEPATPHCFKDTDDVIPEGCRRPSQVGSLNGSDIATASVTLQNKKSLAQFGCVTGALRPSSAASAFTMIVATASIGVGIAALKIGLAGSIIFSIPALTIAIAGIAMIGAGALLMIGAMVYNSCHNRKFAQPEAARFTGVMAPGYGTSCPSLAQPAETLAP